ncbi:hypothetical protein EI555_021657, partial [Monodon monoceros]
SLNVILFLTLHLLPGMKSSTVNLINNGYDGTVIAINPSVPEDEKLIQNIKEMVTEASTYLFHATKRRVYFRNVSILIPMTWKSKSEYLMPKQEAYDQADVIVANSYLKYGDDPHTLQHGKCGEKGQYIHFTPNFLLTNNLPIYGCSIHITGINVTEFCTEKTHDTEAPNLQNKMCNGRTTWDVIMDSDDFQNISPMREMNPPTHPTFSLLKSKQREDCLFRMNQAAELHLIQIIKKGSLVGMAVIYSNQSTSGSEIILLTDREDNEINLCFEEVKQSGAIIHTIALGPSAAKELETLSDMTVGKQSLDNYRKEMDKWYSAYGQYNWKCHFLCCHMDNTKARNSSPSLLNNHASPQMQMVTVTTRARSPTTLPVTSQTTAHYPNPLIVYAQVSQGFLPVLGINVTAIIETEYGHQVTLELWDNGAGTDTVKNDGIYSRYFTDCHGSGRYSLKGHAQERNNMAKLSLRQQQNKALYIPGYVENGKIIQNRPRPGVKGDVAKAEMDFSRLTSRVSFTVSGAPPPGNHLHMFSPAKITDPEAKFKEDHIQLSWTAPSNVLDKENANRYIIRISKSFLDLREDFDNAALVNTSSLIPKEASSIENFEFKSEPFKIENVTYIAV